MRTVLWVLALVLVVAMCTQWGLRAGGTVAREAAGVTGKPKIEGGVTVTPGDALLVVVFVLWAGLVVAQRRFFEVRFPVLAVFVFLALMCVSVLGSPANERRPQELLQLGAYFVGGWLVFANCLATRARLRAAVDVFSLAVAAIVLLALYQYRSAVNGDLFRVGGSFANRNVLGAFLSLALPFLFALALHERRVWQKFALVLTVAFGAAVTLSGGALIALAVALLVVAGVHSQRALVGTLAAVALAVTVMPGLMPVRGTTRSDPAEPCGHADVVLASVSPFVQNNNYLLWEDSSPVPVVGEDDDRLYEDDYYGGPRVAVRYKRWFAALRLIQGELARAHAPKNDVTGAGKEPAEPAEADDGSAKEELSRWPLFGVGPGRYSKRVGYEYGDGHAMKPEGDTDDTKRFNIEADEPDTFNLYLVTLVELGLFGLLALLWVGAVLLGRNVRGYGEGRDDFGKGLALGSAGGVLGAALCAVFSNVLVRGVALPFIFVALCGILWAKLPDAPEPKRSR